MQSKEVSIRKAILSDMETILGLVRELAAYEQEPDAVSVDVSHYEEAFNQNLIESMLAESNGIVIGMTVYYMTFSTWKGKTLYLEDFYIKPEFRKTGIGQMLFDAFIEEAKSKGVKQVKWQVLDWNEMALNFYLKNNATIEKNWWNGKLYFD